jgi:hypothetical protein
MIQGSQKGGIADYISDDDIIIKCSCREQAVVGSIPVHRLRACSPASILLVSSLFVLALGTEEVCFETRWTPDHEYSIIRLVY